MKQLKSVAFHSMLRLPCSVLLHERERFPCQCLVLRVGHWILCNVHEMVKGPSSNEERISYTHCTQEVEYFKACCLKWYLLLRDKSPVMYVLYFLW